MLAFSHYNKSENKYYYENHNTTDTIVDLYNSSKTYEVPKYATVMKNNNFTRNFAGMQGTAVKMLHLSSMNIYNNNFVENGPVTSFSEIEYSPYYKYFALG